MTKKMVPKSLLYTMAPSLGLDNSDGTTAYEIAMSNEEKAKYLQNFNFSFCPESSNYEKLQKIGHGTFGEVYKARDIRSPNKYVALKKVLMVTKDEGFPMTSLREVRILQRLKHINIVNLIEVCRAKSSAKNQHACNLYLVFDFCEHDLAGLLGNINVKFTLGDIKSVVKQLLDGLFFIHVSKIMHRDIKPANILITKSGILKLADFGLARAMNTWKSINPTCYTNRVVTLWYRAPELLLGDRNYGPPIDLWGAGCVMAEMWTRSSIMQGNSEQQQLKLIAQLCGSITPDVWPTVQRLELYQQMKLPKGHQRKVVSRLEPYVQNAEACDLLDKLLQLDPMKRPNADSALNHDFFWKDPMPADLGKMLSGHSQCMFEYVVHGRPNKNRTKKMLGGLAKQPAHDDTYKDRVY